MSSDLGSLDRSSFIPLYHQLKEVILEKIETGEWTASQIIPSESDLQNIFDVSRATVRRTVELLASEGFLEKKRGKGTFVKRPVIEENLPVLKSFTEEMKDRNAKKRVITAQYMEQTSKLRKILDLSPNELIFHLKRLMIVDESPLGILNSYIPERYELSVDEDYSKSLYEILERKGVRLNEADQSIEASMSTNEEIRLLGLKASFPTLVIKRIAYSISGAPVEYVRGVYHGGRYRYSLRLSRYR